MTKQLNRIYSRTVLPGRKFLFRLTYEMFRGGTR